MSRRGRVPAAAPAAPASLEQALEAWPQDPAVHRALADARRALGDELGALAHEIAAQTLAAYAAGTPGPSLGELCTVATGYFMKGDHVAAQRWYRLVLALDPEVAPAHQNLAAIHAARGEMVEAESSRQRAYRIQRVFIEPVELPTRRLLILCVGSAAGNVPVEALLSGGRSLRIKYVIDRADAAEDARLPPFDLVFNAIGDADVAAPLTARLEHFAQACGRPLLNAPAAVALTQRHRLAERLAGLADVVVAPCSRHERPPATPAELGYRLERAGIGWPVLVRRAASHGGDGLTRCDNLPALHAALLAIDGAHYLSAFRDSRGADGHYRKYRVVFVDREPLPYHLAISTHWMVHYFSAAMAQEAWKLGEEHRFLCDPAAALGARATAAIAAIGRRLDLDFGGVDFALLPDGRVLVFEANATMLVHRERQGGPLAHKNAFVDRIVDAFERMLVRASGG